MRKTPSPKRMLIRYSLRRFWWVGAIILFFGYFFFVDTAYRVGCRTQADREFAAMEMFWDLQMMGMLFVFPGALAAFTARRVFLNPRRAEFLQSLPLNRRDLWWGSLLSALLCIPLILPLMAEAQSILHEPLIVLMTGLSAMILLFDGIAITVLAFSAAGNGWGVGAILAFFTVVLPNILNHFMMFNPQSVSVSLSVVQPVDWVYAAAHNGQDRPYLPEIHEVMIWLTITAILCLGLLILAYRLEMRREPENMGRLSAFPKLEAPLWSVIAILCAWLILAFATMGSSTQNPALGVAALYLGAFPAEMASRGTFRVLEHWKKILFKATVLLVVLAALSVAASFVILLRDPPF